MRVDLKFAMFPGPVEVEMAQAALPQVRALLEGSTSSGRVRFGNDEEGGSDVLELPRSAVAALDQVLGHMAAGKGVTVLDAGTELTTQQAADLLNVSRPYVIKLLDAGEIDYRLVGKHRRIVAASLLAYKQADARRRGAAIQELTELSEEMGLY